MRIFWFSVGFIALGLAIIGAFLPVLPTVPFLLLASVGFSKSSEKIHNWLLNHNIFGPPINDWRKNGAISRKVKIYASLSILASIGLTIAMSVVPLVIGFQAVILTIVTIFIWSRPEI